MWVAGPRSKFGQTWTLVQMRTGGGTGATVTMYSANPLFYADKLPSLLSPSSFDCTCTPPSRTLADTESLLSISRAHLIINQQRTSHTRPPGPRRRVHHRHTHARAHITAASQLHLGSPPPPRSLLRVANHARGSGRAHVVDLMYLPHTGASKSHSLPRHSGKALAVGIGDAHSGGNGVGRAPQRSRQ